MYTEQLQVYQSLEDNFYGNNNESQFVISIKQTTKLFPFVIQNNTLKTKDRIFSTDSSEIRDENESKMKNTRKSKEDSSSLVKKKMKSKKYDKQSQQQRGSSSEQIFQEDESSQVNKSLKSKKIIKNKNDKKKCTQQVQQKQENKENSSLGKAKKINDYPTKNMSDYFWKKIMGYLAEKSLQKQKWDDLKNKTGSLALFTQLFQRQQLQQMFKQLFQTRHLVRVIVSSSIGIQKKKKYLRYVNKLYNGFLEKKIQYFN